MIILNKKRIYIILSTILIAIFTFMLQTKNNYETVQTVALPVSQKVIVIDAGHGSPDEGAQSSSRYNRSTD